MNLKYFILSFFVALVTISCEVNNQKAENKRQTENVLQLREYDSLRFASQLYTKKELQDYLDYNRFIVSVVWQKIIAVIAMISTFIFTFGYNTWY